jgi:hypothetical protein
LLVTPKDRKVVVVESLLTPSVERDTLAKVLFCHYDVSEIFHKVLFAKHVVFQNFAMPAYEK